MNNNLKEKLAKSGWVLTNEDFEPPFDFKEELRYNLIGYSVSVLAIIPLLMVLVFLYYYLKLKGKNKRPRMLFGTHAVITFKLLKKVLEEEHDCTLFAFKDNFHKVENVDVITAENIMPGWIARKYPYLLGRYWAFVWALRNFDIFHLYFDGGFLERTIWWKLEPIIYQIFGKRVILYPYGADVWDTFRNSNRLSKLGQMLFDSKYFHSDFKRIKRVYHWSKYVNLIFGPVNYIDFLPRIDIFTFHGHVIKNTKDYAYFFPPINGKVKIIHYANHSMRKGSHIIKKVLNALTLGREDIEFECLEGLTRNELFKRLDGAHIFIDNVIDGYLNYSSIEAMLKGKVVITYIDSDLEGFYIYLDDNYYNKFFKGSPIIKTGITDLRTRIEILLNNKDELRDLSLRNRLFIENLLYENEQAYKLLMSEIVKNQ
ncbi:MAG: hypothetical protein AB1325_10285 [Nitrospirota bacterium]